MMESIESDSLASTQSSTSSRLGIRNYFYVCLSETLVSTRSRVGASHINLPRLKKKKEEKMKKTTEEGAKNTDMVWIYKTE